MADKKWSAADIEITTTGVFVPVLFVDGTSPTGYKNAQIAIADFFNSLQSQITANESDITTLETSVTTLEELLSKVYDADKSTYTINQDADSLIVQFCFTVTSGTPTVKVGTAAGLEDLVSDRLVDGFRSVTLNEYSSSSRTLYITITGGKVDVVRLLRLNLNS